MATDAQGVRPVEKLHMDQQGISNYRLQFGADEVQGTFNSMPHYGAKGIKGGYLLPKVTASLPLILVGRHGGGPSFS